MRAKLELIPVANLTTDHTVSGGKRVRAVRFTAKRAYITIDSDTKPGELFEYTASLACNIAVECAESR